MTVEMFDVHKVVDNVVVHKTHRVAFLGTFDDADIHKAIE